jgi:hypothetical protein
VNHPQWTFENVTSTSCTVRIARGGTVRIHFRRACPNAAIKCYGTEYDHDASPWLGRELFISVLKAAHQAMDAVTCEETPAATPQCTVSEGDENYCVVRCNGSFLRFERQRGKVWRVDKNSRVTRETFLTAHSMAIGHFVQVAQEKKRAGAIGRKLL